MDLFVGSFGRILDLRFNAPTPAFCSRMDCLKAIPECDDVHKYTDQVCVSDWIKNIPGMVVLVLLLAFAAVSVSCLRHIQFGALVRKNFLVRRHKLTKSILLQLFEASMLGLLVVVVLVFTSYYTQYEDVTTAGRRLTVVYSIPDNNRSSLFKILIPFGGLIFLIVFTYPIASIVISFVTEKETRMKESLRISGMRDLDFTCSWYLTILVKCLPICVTTAFLVYFGQICPNNSVSESGIFFLCFIFEMIGFSQLLTIFFDSSTRLAALANVLLAYIFYFISFGIDSSSTSGFKLGMCFLPSLCLNYGAQNMLSSANQAIGLDLNVDNIQYPSPWYCSLLMVTWGIIYSFIAWYLEYVLPQQYGVRKHWTFPIKMVASWCRKCCSKKSEGEQVESLIPGKLTVTDLRKVFKVPELESGERVAVDNLNFSM